MEDWRVRLSRIVDERLDGNWSNLARLADLSASTVHRLKTESDPRLGTISKIAKALNVSVSFLVEGESVEGVTGSQRQPMAPEGITVRPTSRSVNAKQVGLDALEIEEILLLAEGSAMRLAWPVLLKLATAHPQALTELQIRDSVGSDFQNREIGRALLLLERTGAVLKDGDHFKLSKTSAKIGRGGIADTAEHARTSLEALTNVIFPAVEASPPQGSLVTAMAYVDRNRSSEAVAEITHATREIWERYTTHRHDDATPLCLVMGLASGRELG